ncbi:MAG TPA: phosphatase PAP2 family protein [Verrucomicrobiae bacterium]|jgi:membrane-associated phospholipid phosphatase|nr:phosphatase PAP2 family protein [Verrucomicrobiae bacterium]
MNRPTKLTAAVTTGGLSVLFVIVYGSCNWVTAHRNDVGTWYYSWEHLIPFVPVMIVPYMSINLFFVSAPFLCRSREELRTFALRVAFAILIAGVCFLSMPLKLGTPVPPTSGWTGVIFDFLHRFDQPYNLAPSLHITFRTILANLFARHTKGVLRIASHIWFFLIGLSTVMTYQHHIVDVAAGFILAAVCFYLFRETNSACRKPGMTESVKS